MSNSDKKLDDSVCEECKLNPWKYKCPGCSIRSCGLPCVKAHKKRTGCTGKRKVTDFVPLSQFDDNRLLSDYNMLEETKRVAESAQRMRNHLCRNPYSNIPVHLQSLRSAAASRRTTLLILPSGMLKRQTNKTRYDYRSKCISWTIEWRFHSTDVVLVDHGVGEDTSLCSVIENHLKPGPWIHKLKPFCDVDINSLKLFVRLTPKGAKAPFKELDIKAPLRRQLAKVVIFEYPVIHVYLPSQSSYDFEVIRDLDHVNTTTPNLNDGHGSTQDITSREEEIEGDDSEPKVLDYLSCNQGNSHPQADPAEEGDDDNMELEFDQELIDTYAELFAEMNPGDYFNFECEFAKGFDSDDNCNLHNLATDFNADGLEEGEIVE